MMSPVRAEDVARDAEPKPDAANLAFTPGRISEGTRRLPYRCCRRERTRAVWSFDDLVGAGEQLVGDFEAERLRGSEIDYEVKFRGLLDRQVGWLFAFENAASVVAG